MYYLISSTGQSWVSVAIDSATFRPSLYFCSLSFRPDSDGSGLFPYPHEKLDALRQERKTEGEEQKMNVLTISLVLLSFLPSREHGNVLMPAGN